MSPRAFAFLAGFFCVTGCATSPSAPPAPEPPPMAASAVDPEAETARLHAFLDEVYEAELMRNPVGLSYQGRKDRQDEIFPRTLAWEENELAEAQAALATMKAEFDPDALSFQGALSYRLFAYEVEAQAAQLPYYFHGYRINQMFGVHSWLPNFMMEVHRVDAVEDAQAYIKRLQAISPLMAEVHAEMKLSQEKGVLPPRFVFPYVIEDCQNIIKGAPFDQGDDSILLADIKAKVEALEGVEGDVKAALIHGATEALKASVGPAYEATIALLQGQQAVATDDDGVWKLPDGEAYYAQRLRRHTTTDLSAEAIHDIGLKEVSRIHDEMRAIQASVGFEGTLQDFFAHLRTDPRFYYANTDEGRSQYLADATALVEAMEARLGEFFVTMPKSKLEVMAVEDYRARSAGKAFYSRGTPDGSRPGRYYVNLYDMADMPNYQMEALVYHEGLPGHHMQGSIAQELGDDIPKFRRMGYYGAYGEGWGLYSEYMPKEFGFYADPYSDFGRLAMELWRACRLVVDTGIHHMKWTRQQSIDYLLVNTPNPEGEAIKAIERYIVAPGQATSYKIGQLKILEMRARAQEALGDDFDLRDFHEAILTTGSLPLDLLEEVVDAWIDEQR